MKFVRNITVPIKPGYAQFPPELPGKMIVTSFEGTPLVGKHAVYVLDTSAGDTNAVPQQLPGTDKIDWPNAATGVDPSVFGFPAVIVGSGFLVPSHTTGGIWLMEASANPTNLTTPAKITKDKQDKLPDSGWFYHQGELKDMDGDGKLDIVTARCQFGVWPWAKKNGELVWLQQPTENPLTQTPWVEHKLIGGPDFTFCKRPGDGPLALAAPEFINETIMYYHMQNGTLQSRILDDTSGPGFSCTWTDLNGDGRLELLATNHQNQNGSVYAYSFDGDDPATATVSRHVLASGFSAVTTKQGTASPGDAFAFQPKVGATTKPHIFVSADNADSVFILVPNSEDPNDFQYAKQELAYLGADIGRPAIGDTDEDGYADIYIPAYDNSVLVHYAFASTTLSVPESSILI